MTSSSLGIYFGPKIISIIESKGKTILHNVQVSQDLITSSEIEEKVPSEVKIVALFKDELRRNKIESNEVSLALSGKDFVIRTFEMPVIPRNELDSAVRFEAKKYIPFKIEDLIADFQVQYDKLSRRNIILFAGIKKDVLDKYLSILSQLDIKPVAIEYSAFSVLRLMKLLNISSKGIIGIISADFKEEDEINFTFLENGFPLFSRDITLTGSPDELAVTKEKDSGMMLEKLKTEIRVSLDYYHRKFPAKKIEKTFFVASQEYQADLESFVKYMGLSAQFIDIKKTMGETAAFSLSAIKGYSASLSKTIKTELKINLLTAKEKSKQKETVARPITEISPPLFSGLKPNPKVVILGTVICLVTYAFLGLFRTMPLKKELAKMIEERPQISGLKQDMVFEDLIIANTEYHRKAEAINNLFKGQLYVTKLLEVIARVKPEGIWFKNINFKKEELSAMLTVDGMAYLTDSDKEFTLVNKFLANLKDSSDVTKYFKDINIISLEHSQFRGVYVTTFTITCRTSKKVKE